MIPEKDTSKIHRGADKSLARPASWCTLILFDGENISIDASLVIYITSTNLATDTEVSGSIPGATRFFWVVVGLERGLLSLVRSTEELLE